MTSTKNTDTNNTHPVDQPAPSSFKSLLKEALANKNSHKLLPEKNKTVDKGIKIGMPPRGTRRSMGKR